MTTEKKSDKRFEELNENKVQKSLRNSKEFAEVLARAQKGEFDEDIDDAYGMDLLKVTEIWSIRKQFSLEEGKFYYKLYKEVFYVADPHKYYFDTVEPTILRRISGQKETGDKEWADAVSKEMGIKIVEG